MGLDCANTAEWIKVLFGMETLGDPWNIRFLHRFEVAFARLLRPHVLIAFLVVYHWLDRKI